MPEIQEKINTAVTTSGNKSGKNRHIVIETKLIKSKAWLNLNGTAKAVYLIFRTKCRMEKVRRQTGREPWSIANDGEIVFTYREAESKYKITQPRFSRAIDSLIEKGFIDIAKPGKPVAKEATLYAISERWRDDDTPTFKKAKRQKVKVGYCKTRKTASTIETDDKGGDL